MKYEWKLLEISKNLYQIWFYANGEAIAYYPFETKEAALYRMGVIAETMED